MKGLRYAQKGLLGVTGEGGDSIWDIWDVRDYWVGSFGRFDTG